MYVQRSLPSQLEIKQLEENENDAMMMVAVMMEATTMIGTLTLQRPTGHRRRRGGAEGEATARPNLPPHPRTDLPLRDPESSRHGPTATPRESQHEYRAASIRARASPRVHALKHSRRAQSDNCLRNSKENAQPSSNTH